MKLYIAKILSLLLLVVLSSCERPNDSDAQDDGIPPAVPSGIQFYYANDGEIGLEWNSNDEPDMRGYNIYRRINDSAYFKLLFTLDNFYFDDSLTYDDEYSYRISAVDKSGRESELSVSITTRAANMYRPLPPDNIEINARNWEEKRSIFLRWTQNRESDIAGFNIYRSPDEGFTADSTNLQGFSSTYSYTDTNSLDLYTTYYYQVKTVDKGGLLSRESDILSDKIYGVPAIIFPANGETTEYFQNFKIMTIDVPATYKIIVQENEFFGELWSTTINTSGVNTILNVPFTARGIEINKKYYWRVVTYSVSSEPNSITGLYNFTVK